MIEFLCLSRGYFAAPAAEQGSAISALRAAAMRRLRSETRLRAQADGGIKLNPVISEDTR